MAVLPTRFNAFFAVVASLLAMSIPAAPAQATDTSSPYPLNPKLLDLPKRQWVKIHQQQFGDPVTFRRQRHGGSAFDSRRGRLVLFGSDTHGNNWLNSPLYFDLGRLEWQQQYPADPLASYRVTSQGLPVAGPEGDHPWAMHTFGAVTYDPAADTLIVASLPQHMVPGRFSHALAELWPQVRQHPTWLLHLESGEWEPLVGEAVHFFPNAIAYDTRRGVAVGYKKKGVFELSLTTGRWQRVARGGLLNWANNVAFDSSNGVLIAYGDNKRHEYIVVYDPGTGKHQKMPSPGARPAGDKYVPMAFDPGLGQVVAIIDELPEGSTRTRDAVRSQTWSYDYTRDAWTRIESADLPFPIGMNFNLEYDPGHQLLLLVATPPDKSLPAVWALRF